MFPGSVLSWSKTGRLSLTVGLEVRNLSNWANLWRYLLSAVMALFTGKVLHAFLSSMHRLDFRRFSFSRRFEMSRVRFQFLI